MRIDSARLWFDSRAPQAKRAGAIAGPFAFDGGLASSPYSVIPPSAMKFVPVA